MRQEFTQELKNIYHSNMQDIHTSVPGQILSFDPEKCEAKIKPIAMYRKPDDSLIDFPYIFHVPIFFMQSFDQTATIVYPIKPGDGCIIFFSEQALDLWRTGAQSKTDLRFDLTNAYAIVGMPSNPNPLVNRACDNESIIIQRENSYIEFFDKEIKIDTDGDINTAAAININITTGANTTIRTAGETNIISGGNCNVRAANINLN